MLFEELAWHDLYSFSPPALIFDMGQGSKLLYAVKRQMPLDYKDYARMASKRYLRFWPRETYFNQHFFKRRVMSIFGCSWRGRMDLLQVDQQLLLAGLGCAKAQESFLRSCLRIDFAVFFIISKKGHENACRQLLQSWRWKTFEVCWSHALNASAWTRPSTGRYARCPCGCLQQQSDHPVQRLPELHTARGDCPRCAEAYNFNLV